MNEEIVVNSRVARGDHKRLSINDKSDVADKTLVKDSVNSFAIEMTALGQSYQIRAARLRECCHARDSNLSTCKMRVGDRRITLPCRPRTLAPTLPNQLLLESLSSEASEAKVDRVSLMLPLIPFAVMTDEPPFPICPEYVPCLLRSIETSDKSEITLPLIP